MNTSKEIKFLRLDRQYENIREEILEATDDALKNGIWVDGPFAEKLRNWLTKRTGIKHAVLFHSGTNALEALARRAYEHRIREVEDYTANLTAHVPTFGFPATASAFKNNGWNIKFYDCDKNGQPNYKSIGTGHYGSDLVVGCPLFGEHVPPKGFFNEIVYDLCQSNWLHHYFKDAMYLKINAAISFDPTKNLSGSGNGGAILTNNETLAQWAERWHNHGKNYSALDQWYGTNSRMSEQEAAQILVRSKYIDIWQLRRKEIAQHYINKFEKTDIRVLINEQESHTFQKFVIDVGPIRDRLQYELECDGIETKIHYKYPLHELFTEESGPNMLSTATMLSRQVLSLPIYPEMTDSEVEYVTEKVVRNYKFLAEK